MASIGGVLLQAVVYVLFVGAVLAAYRAIARRSSLLAAIFAIGVSVRCVLGAALFLISYFQLPVFASAQMGGGFWTLALDGRWYYDAASHALSTGIGSIPDGSASPAYVRALAIWMALVGVSPPSAALLNVACYTLAALLIVRATHSDTPGALALGVLTFSPALLIFGTQALKDTLCILLLVMALAGIRVWVSAVEAVRMDARSMAGGALLLTASIYGLVGTRAYLAVLLLGSYAVISGLTLYRILRRRQRWRAFIAYSALGVWLVATFAVGDRAYYRSYRDLAVQTVLSPVYPFVELVRVRTGFNRTGGATAVEPGPAARGADLTTASAPAGESLGAGDQLAISGRPGLGGHVRRLATGVALLVVPISVLKMLSVVSFTGGRGLLVVTDIDTILIDIALAGSLLWLFTRKLERMSVPVMLFALVLSVVTALAMAYAVTNFGTLFRLRLVALAPLWLLPAFCALREEARFRPVA